MKGRTTIALVVALSASPAGWGPARADDAITDRARPVLTDLVIQCRRVLEGYKAGIDQGPDDACQEAMDRWDLLPATDKFPKMYGHMADLMLAKAGATIAALQIGAGKPRTQARREQFNAMRDVIEAIAARLSG